MKKMLAVLSCCLMSAPISGAVVSCSSASKSANHNDSDYSNLNNHEIAHAGGEIDGHVYTNTLDALENSYKNGIRYFEFDFQSVKDKNGKTHYVCTHNWEKWGWQSKTNDGKVEYVPSYEEFTSKKLWGKYTALTFELANEWFSKHTDAFLITDKTDDPKYFTENFYDKSKLRMELFSVDSLNWSIKNNFEGAMVSSDLLFYGNSNDRNESMKMLENDKIHYLVSGNTKDNYLLVILKKVHDTGTRTFMYFDNGFKNEDITRTLKKVKTFVDGFYADDSTYRFK